jgi:Methylase involved in ubiquinone/menaquinone biosynthesis
VKERIVETNEGIQGELDAAMFDVFARDMRDRGLTEEKRIIKEGITCGHALEIGPGPGYLGLEWLKRVKDGRLTGIEISGNMIRLAEKNAREYGLEGRCAYVQGNAVKLPFEDGGFDAVFSNGSLHEWEDPAGIIGEAYRVLKTGGRLFVSDLKRDIAVPLRLLMSMPAKPRQMRKGLKSSIEAAYTAEEITRIVAKTPFRNTRVEVNPFGLRVICVKG